MNILAFLHDPPVVSAILLHLDLPHKPPPTSPARAPPQSDLLLELLDQSPALDPSKPDRVPDHASRGALEFGRVRRAMCRHGWSR
jgi:hypothetical protein